MGRVISQSKIDGIAEARLNSPNTLGPMLGELVIGGNVPIAGIAMLLRVSNPTVYRWMYGYSEPTDADKILKIKRLLTVLRKAKRAKDLPMHGSIKERLSALRALVITHGQVPVRT